MKEREVKDRGREEESKRGRKKKVERDIKEHNCSRTVEKRELQQSRNESNNNNKNLSIILQVVYFYVQMSQRLQNFSYLKRKNSNKIFVKPYTLVYGQNDSYKNNI